jgi:hypothetical protein
MLFGRAYQEEYGELGVQNVRGEENTGFCSVNLRERGHLENLDVDGR